MKYTAGQAATATGISKATITRALKSGRISGKKDESGAWIIDPAELHRVFPAVAGATQVKRLMQRSATPDEAPDFKAFERENQMMREALEAALNREREINADLMADRDHWRQQATALLLSPPKRRSWWPWG
ncbi:MerR family transcriptional regulator [Falsigemmobacter faecalis]|uniref:Uncharacterized protein n=1 Tax=Falsigemmobacter faecalis TaxID=2488730 RepID=A0A3P3D132_9RHOB|nr:hypothetical protein [Falsigemmobacter faecalis]RRH68153.1 hypothetical protein EG244_19715 [Falsigemmobacter faecalis]